MIPIMANQMEKSMGKKWKLASDDLGFFWGLCQTGYNGYRRVLSGLMGAL